MSGRKRTSDENDGDDSTIGSEAVHPPIMLPDESRDRLFSWHERLSSIRLKDAMRTPGPNGGGPDNKDFIQADPIGRPGAPHYVIDLDWQKRVVALSIQDKPDNVFYTPLENVRDYQVMAEEAKGKAK